MREELLPDENEAGMDPAVRRMIRREARPSFLDDLLQTAPALIFIHDPATHGIVWCNRVMERTFGVTREEILARGEQFMEEIIHPEDFHLSMQRKNYYHRLSKDSFGGLIRVKTIHSADWKWFIGISTAFRRDQRGKVIQTLCIFLDFTAAVHTEAQMNEALRYVLSRHHKDMLEKLTSREKEIIQCLIEGYTNAEIAGRLGISRYTVESYRKNIRIKLNVKNTPELIAYAKKLGL